MISRRALLGGAIAATAAVVAGVASRRLLPDNAAVGKVWGLELPDLEGHVQRLAQWKGKILLVNFWATWCEPCRDEIPILVRMQAKYAQKNVQLVGISIDSVDKIREFIPKLNINYPLVIGGMESLALLRDLGNQSGTLPYTTVLGMNGDLVQKHLGPLIETDLDKLLKSITS